MPVAVPTSAAPIPAPTVAPTQPPKPANPGLILATTTSTQDSGLLDVLIPAFEEKTGYVVKTVAVGTGQALEMGQQGNADVLLVHAPASEKTFMADALARIAFWSCITTSSLWVQPLIQLESRAERWPWMR